MVHVHGNFWGGGQVNIRPFLLIINYHDQHCQVLPTRLSEYQFCVVCWKVVGFWSLLLQRRSNFAICPACRSRANSFDQCYQLCSFKSPKFLYDFFWKKKTPRDLSLKAVNHVKLAPLILTTNTITLLPKPVVNKASVVFFFSTFFFWTLLVKHY